MGPRDGQGGAAGASVACGRGVDALLVSMHARHAWGRGGGARRKSFLSKKKNLKSFKGFFFGIFFSRSERARADVDLKMMSRWLGARRSCVRARNEWWWRQVSGALLERKLVAGCVRSHDDRHSSRGMPRPHREN